MVEGYQKMYRWLTFLVMILGGHLLMASISHAAQATGAKEYIGFELGVTKETLIGVDGGQTGTFVSYIRKGQSDFYGELYIGSINGSRPSNLLFAAIGYWHSFSENLFLRGSLGIGYTSELSDYLSSHNIFTEVLSLGYHNFSLSFRHMSNGRFLFGNPGRNLGENALLLGFQSQF